MVLPGGWVAVTRSNNKEWDDLHLRVELSGQPATSAAAIPIVLAPTVDTAGPSLTTWQGRDTLRFLLPWVRTLRPRRLNLFVSYHAVSYDGRLSACGGILSSDTLHFTEPPSEPSS